MDIKTIDGKSYLYQWDTDRYLVIDGVQDGTEVHFAYDDKKALSVPYTEGKVKVPNIILQTGHNIKLWTYADDHTICEDTFTVIPRLKPEDYVYTEDEVHTWVELDKRIDALQEEFIKRELEFIQIVEELPEEGQKNQFYFVPIPDAEDDNNLFDEWMWVNGKWEHFGTVGITVDLSEYVKRTDYASSADAGVVKVNPELGLNVNKNGQIHIEGASRDNISKKSSARKPIVPTNLDYAVKKALSDCKLTDDDIWTTEEKAAARGLLEAVGSEDYADVGEYGLVKLAKESFGITKTNEGALRIYPAPASGIKGGKRSYSYAPITPTTMDLAVKDVLSNYQAGWGGVWTEEEQQSARDLLGVNDIKHLPVNEDGYVLYDLEVGIYQVDKNVKIFSPKVNANTMASNATMIVVYDDATDTKNAYAFYKQSWYHRLGYMSCGAEGGTGLVGIDLNYTSQINKPQTISAVKTFTANPKITAEQSDYAESSTNVPTMAWTQGAIRNQWELIAEATADGVQNVFEFKELNLKACKIIVTASASENSNVYYYPRIKFANCENIHRLGYGPYILGTKPWIYELEIETSPYAYANGSSGSRVDSTPKDIKRYSFAKQEIYDVGNIQEIYVGYPSEEVLLPADSVIKVYGIKG